MKKGQKTLPHVNTGTNGKRKKKTRKPISLDTLIRLRKPPTPSAGEFG